MSFKSQIQIHFDEADPAGIAFFGGVFTKVHQCYEEFIKAMGIELETWFLNPEIIAPIRHTEAEYFKPLMPFQTYDVETQVLSISESSFKLQFTVQQNDKKHVTVQTTHVCCDPKVMKKISIPQSLKMELEKFL